MFFLQTKPTELRGNGLLFLPKREKNTVKWVACFLNLEQLAGRKLLSAAQRREQLSIFLANCPFDLQDTMQHLRMCIISAIKIQAAPGTTVKTLQHMRNIDFLSSQIGKFECGTLVFSWE